MPDKKPSLLAASTNHQILIPQKKLLLMINKVKVDANGQSDHLRKNFKIWEKAINTGRRSQEQTSKNGSHNFVEEGEKMDMPERENGFYPLSSQKVEICDT